MMKNEQNILEHTEKGNAYNSMASPSLLTSGGALGV
jgi:hypothetical protein